MPKLFLPAAGAAEQRSDCLAHLRLPPSGHRGAPIVLEAENGTLTGNAYVSTAVSGYSGAGYVTGLQSTNDTINWRPVTPI